MQKTWPQPGPTKRDQCIREICWGSLDPDAPGEKSPAKEAPAVENAPATEEGPAPEENPDPAPEN